jgi:hypothetical protein
LPLAHFTPAELIRLREPFDSAEYVYEVAIKQKPAAGRKDSGYHWSNEAPPNATPRISLKDSTACSVP